jgi:hypothetical protein
MLEAVNDAESRMAPADVSQCRCGNGERKKTRAACDVWVSSMSANHCSHLANMGLSSSRP